MPTPSLLAMFRRRIRSVSANDDGFTLTELIVTIGLTTLVGVLAMSAIVVVQNHVVGSTERAIAQQEARSIVDGTLHRLRAATPRYQCTNPPAATTAATCNKVGLAATPVLAGGSLAATDKRFCVTSPPADFTGGDLVALDQVCVLTRERDGKDLDELVVQVTEPAYRDEFLGDPEYADDPTFQFTIGYVDPDEPVFEYFDLDQTALSFGSEDADGARPVTGSTANIAIVRLHPTISFRDGTVAGTEQLDLIASIRSTRFLREQDWIDERLIAGTP